MPQHALEIRDESRIERSWRTLPASATARWPTNTSASPYFECGVRHGTRTMTNVKKCPECDDELKVVLRVTDLRTCCPASLAEPVATNKRRCKKPKAGSLNVLSYCTTNDKGGIQRRDSHNVPSSQPLLSRGTPEAHAPAHRAPQHVFLPSAPTHFPRSRGEKPRSFIIR